jgi:hypothetical protein
MQCQFNIEIPPLSDPVQGCAKDFVAVYRCPSDEQPRMLEVPAVADGKTVDLRCTSDD